MKQLLAPLTLIAALGCSSSTQDPVEESPFLMLDAVNNSNITVQVNANTTTSAFVDPAERAVLAVQDAWQNGLGLFIEVIWQDSVMSNTDLTAQNARKGESYEVVVTDSSAHLFRGRR